MPTGCSTSQIFTVNPNPAAVGGNLAVCAGATITLSDATTGGTWASGTTTVATAGSGTGVMTGVAANTSVITYKLPTGCIVTAPVTVNALPAAIAGTFSVCGIGTATLTDATTGGHWTSSATTVANIGSATGVVTGVATGTTNIIYALTATGCTASQTLTVNPNPASIGGNVALCAGATITLSDATTGGTWASGTTGVATAGSGTGVITGVSANTSIITYKLPTGCSVAAPVTVNAVPSAITGTLSVCGTGTTTLTDATTGGYWISGTTATANIGSATGTVTGAATGTTTITYALAATGCYARRAFSVNPNPAAIGGNVTVCAGSTITLTDATTGGTWASGTTTIALAGSGTGVITGVAANTSLITYKLPTGCSISVPVTVNAVPLAIAGTFSVCGTGTTTLTDGTTGGHWTSGTTTVANIGSATGVVTGVTANTTVITYALNTTGCSAKQTFTVNANPVAIAGAAALCAGATTTMTDATTGGHWSSSNTAIAIIGSSTGVVTTSSSSGPVTIQYLVGVCPATKGITVYPATSPVTGDSVLCGGTTTTLADATTGGTWRVLPATVASIGAGTGLLVAGSSTGTAIIQYTPTDGCTVSKIITINISPSAITGVAVLCGGITSALSDAVTAGTWSSSNTGVVTVGTATGIATGLINGTATITYTLASGCSQTLLVSVNTSSGPAAITGDVSTFCGGSTATFYDATTGGTWSSSNTSIATVGSSAGLVTGALPGTATIFYTAPVTGCPTDRIITIEQAPSAIVGTTNLCTNDTVMLSDAVTGGTWSSQYTTVATVNATTGQVIPTWIYASSINNLITYTLSDGCQATITQTVNPAFALSGSPVAGIGGTTTFVGGSSSIVGTWSQSNSAVASLTVLSTSYECQVTGIANGTTVVTYTTTAGCINTDIVTIGSGRHSYSTATTETIPTATDLKLIPNPNNGAFTIKGTLTSVGNEIISVDIRNMVGQSVCKGNIVTYNGAINEQIQLSNSLTDGMYLINLQTQSGNYVFHFVLQK